MKNMLAFCILLFAAQTASAKCASDFFEFSGTVTDKTGAPLTGAIVGISWSEKYGPTGPALGVTDADGHYKISIAFNTYSGKGAVVEDTCNLRIRFVSVSAYKGQYRSPYHRVTIGNPGHVHLPIVAVWLPAQSKPAVRIIRPSG